MPYQAFHSAAEALNYDVHVLAQRFNAGFEQVCHRLTTLQRPNARGVPFFLLRVDNAGNVSKRFSSGTFPFSKFGGTCPLWNVHSTFDTPDRLLKPGDRTARRHALFLDRADGAPSGGAAPAAAAALCHWPRVRNPPRVKTRSTPPGWIWRRPRARRSASTAGSAERESCAQRAEPRSRAQPDPRREHAPGVVVRVLERTGIVRALTLRVRAPRILVCSDRFRS